MTPDRPLFTHSPEERDLLAFYDTVPAAELLARASDASTISVADFLEPAVTWAQAVALVQERLGATVIEDETRH